MQNQDHQQKWWKRFIISVKQCFTLAMNITKGFGRNPATIISGIGDWNCTAVLSTLKIATFRFLLLLSVYIIVIAVFLLHDIMWTCVAISQ